MFPVQNNFSMCLLVIGITVASASQVPAEQESIVVTLHGGNANNVLQFNRVVFSPDGKRIAATGQEGKVYCWDLPSGKQVFAFETGWSVAAYGVTISPDGKMIATCGKGVQLWEAENGKQIRSIEEQKAIYSIVFRPDSKVLATGGKELKTWDIATGKEIKCFREQNARFTSIAYSPDGKQLASASSDGFIRIWDGDGKEVIAIEQGGSLDTLCFSPDGKRLAAANHKDKVVVWNVETGKKLLELVGKLCVAFSPDGKQVVSVLERDDGDSYDLAISDATTGKRVKTIPNVGAISSIAYHPDGKWLGFVSVDSTVIVRDLTRLPKK